MRKRAERGRVRFTLCRGSGGDPGVGVRLGEVGGGDAPEVVQACQLEAEQVAVICHAVTGARGFLLCTTQPGTKAAAGCAAGSCWRVEVAICYG